MLMKKIINIGIIFTTIVILIACNSDTSIDTSTVKDTALSKFKDYSNSNGTTTTPTIQDYLDAGVIGVSDRNIADINEVISNLTTEDVDTTEEIQVIANSLGVTVTVIPTPTPTPTPVPVPVVTTPPPVVVTTPPPTVLENTAPLATAGTDQNITVGITPLYNFERIYSLVTVPSSTVRLDANSSTDDNLPQGTLTYFWDLISLNVPSILLSDATSVQPTFKLSCSDNYSICPLTDVYTCTYEFKVTVSDGELSSSDTTIVQADYGVCLSDIPLQN